MDANATSQSQKDRSFFFYRNSRILSRLGKVDELRAALSKSISDIEILSQHLVPVVPDHTTPSRRALMWRPSAGCDDKEVLNRMLACARPKICSLQDEGEMIGAIKD